MRFISTIPKLQVNLQSARQGFDPNTGKTMDAIPAVIAKFNFGVYETTDERIIRMMLIRMINAKRSNMQVTYGIHPEDMHLIASIKQELEKEHELEMPMYSLNSPAKQINENALVAEELEKMKRENEILKNQLAEKTAKPKTKEDGGGNK